MQNEDRIEIIPRASKNDGEEDSKMRTENDGEEHDGKEDDGDTTKCTYPLNFSTQSVTNTLGRRWQDDDG